MIEEDFSTYAGVCFGEDDASMCTYATTELCHLIPLRPVKFRVAELLASIVEEIGGKQVALGVELCFANRWLYNADRLSYFMQKFSIIT